MVSAKSSYFSENDASNISFRVIREISLKDDLYCLSPAAEDILISVLTDFCLRPDQDVTPAAGAQRRTRTSVRY